MNTINKNMSAETCLRLGGPFSFAVPRSLICMSVRFKAKLGVTVEFHNIGMHNVFCLLIKEA